MGNKVNIVIWIRYFGHTITNDINDSWAKPVINDFNVKLNTFLAYFNDVACDIKNTLFKQYCTSFMDFIYVHYLIEKLKICILLWEKLNVLVMSMDV